MAIMNENGEWLGLNYQTYSTPEQAKESFRTNLKNLRKEDVENLIKLAEEAKEKSSPDEFFDQAEQINPVFRNLRIWFGMPATQGDFLALLSIILTILFQVLPNAKPDPPILPEPSVIINNYYNTPSRQDTLKKTDASEMKSIVKKKSRRSKTKH